MALLPTLGPDGRPTPVTGFLTVHHALRRDAHRFPVALRAGIDPAAIAGHWARYRSVLVQHHEMEDDVLFPTLRDAVPSLAEVIDRLDAEHAGLHEVMDAVDAGLAALTGAGSGDTETGTEAGTGTGDALAPAVTAFERLAAVIDAHLDREEEHLVPVMAAGPGPGGPPSEDGPGAGGPPEDGPPGGFDDPAFQLPWLADGLDPQVVDGLLSVLPPSFREGFPAWQAAYGTGPLVVASGAVA